MIFDGDEGLGKTTIADCLALQLAYNKDISRIDPVIVTEVIDNKKSTDRIEGGKDVAKNVLAEMHTAFIPNQNKVIIMDECHGMSEAAQDVFLSDTEYMPDNVYVFMLTTEPQGLKPTLRSRAVPIHLSPLTLADMLTILQREVNQRNLTIQGGENTLRTIAEWSENKPRTALSILSAFNNESVSEETINSFIGYIDPGSILQLLCLLSKSMINGLDYISTMNVSQSIIPIVTEYIKVKSGFHSYKLKYDDMKNARDMLINVETEQLITFLYVLTSQPKVTRTLLLNAFMRAHKNHEKLLKESPKVVLEMEKAQRMENSEITPNNVMNTPTLESLLGESTIITDDL